MASESSFEIYIPENLTFNDYLSICQTARVWADGYDLKSFDRLLSTLAPTVLIDYSRVNPDWGIKKYSADEFASLWMSAEHLGNRVLATQHLLATPYFTYVGSRKETSNFDQADQGEVEEAHVSWQILASHARRAGSTLSSSSDGQAENEAPLERKLKTESSPFDPVESETSDHRSFIEHQFIKIPVVNGIVGGKRWKLAVMKPSLLYAPGDFGRVRRAEGEP